MIFNMKKLISLIICLACAIISTAQADIQALWSTNAALPGEKVVLLLQNEHKDLVSPVRIRQVTPGKIKNGHFIQNRSSRDNYYEEALADANGNTYGRVEIFMILVEVGGSGKVECENIEVTLSSGQKESVKIPELPVYTTAKVEWRTVDDNNATDNGKPLTFGTMWLTEPQEYYAGQPIQASLKLLLPSSFNRLEQQPGIVSQGVKADPFRTPIAGAPGALIQHWFPLRERTVQARGQQWVVMDLEVNLIPQNTAGNKEGEYDVYVSVPCLFQMKETIAESTGNYTFHSTTIRPLPLTLKLPKLALNTPRPLPPNPPADFSDMVGSFSISTSTEAKDLAMNEMIDVQITVKGTGSLEQLTCPQPREAENWKLMPPTRKIEYSPTGKPQAVIFSQLMRPVVEVAGVPSFSFSYFDAEAEEYKTAESQPIGLPWRATEAAGSGQVTAASAAPPAGTVPVAELADIYHFLPNESEGGNAAATTLPKWLWYLLYLPGAGILLWLIGKRAYNAWAQKAGLRNRDKALNRIAAEPDAAAFLKGIGAFIESNIPNAANTPELQAILNKRDAEVFRPDATPHVTKEEKSAMLRSVRKALSCLVAAFAVLGAIAPLCPAADSAMKHYEAGQYSKALEELEAELKAETDTRDRGELLYNIGNCKYRLNEPGEAALYYARALQESPGLAEAEANLAFIQRKEGAILPQQDTADKVFTFLSYPQLWVATIICTATLLLCIALSLLLKDKLKLTLRTLIGISLFLSLLCGADYIYYATRSVPDLTATPPADLAYITKATSARSAALDTAKKVVELPASTPVHLRAIRGNHRYVETFSGVRGWVPADSVTALDPHGTSAKAPVILKFE